MKRLLYAVVLLLLTCTACVDATRFDDTEPELPYGVDQFDYNGHSYLAMWLRYGPQEAITFLHDPDCPKCTR